MVTGGSLGVVVTTDHVLSTCTSQLFGCCFAFQHPMHQQKDLFQVLAGFLSEDQEWLSSNTLEEMAVIRHYLLQHPSQQECEKLISKMMETLSEGKQWK